MPREPLTPTRLDVAATIRASLWFFVVGLALKLFWLDELSWWVITAPLWSSAFFTTFTTNYTETGRKKRNDER
jgi:hypothetical protein